MQAQWDPWKVLDLYPGRRDFSCIGTAAGSGLRCNYKLWFGKWKPAEADLKRMSTTHPSQVSDGTLYTLAQDCLCADWHQGQAYDKAQRWRARIAEYLGEVKEQPDPADELRKVKAELEQTKKQCTNPGELASLRGKVVESASMIQALRESETARQSKIISLDERLAASDLTILTLERTQEANLQEIQSLIEKCAVGCNRPPAANELYEESKLENIRLRMEKDVKAEEVDRLKQDVRNLKADLEGSQRVQRSKGRETDNLRQQLNASNALIKELQATKIDTTCLHQEIKDIKKALIENSSQVSQLQQENQRLKTQRHFRAFRDHVRLLAKQKTYERTAAENQTLLEQGSRLAERLEEADLQLAAQDRILSLFRLKNVTKGICAVISTQPRQLSIRRVSKIVGPSA